MNPIGIYFAFWEKNWQADYLAYIDKVSRLGFDVLEIAAGPLADMTQRQLQMIKDAAAEKNLKLTYCIGLPAEYDVAHEDAAVRKNGIQFVGRLLDAIHFLGGDTLGGIIYSSWPGAVASYSHKLAARERSIASVRELCKKAEDRGIQYCLEVVNRFEQYIINTAAEGVSFAKEVESPNCKLLLDAFHMNIEEDYIGDAIRSAKGYVGHFHIGECNRKVPGRGHMPWDEMMRALNEIGYSGTIVMEPFVKPGGQVGQDIKVYRDLSSGASEEEMDAMAKEALAFIRSKNL